MKETWKFELLTSWDEVLSNQFWAQWDAWYRSASSRHVFFSPVLAKVWLDTYLPIRNLRPLYLTARSGSATVFLPLVLWRRNWKNGCQRAIVPVGDSDYDYHDPLVIGDPGSIDWARFWSCVSSLLDVRADAIRIDGLRPHCVPMPTQPFQASDGAPFADLSGLHSGEEYLVTLKKSVRGDMLRCLRRLEERGSVSYHVFGPTEIADALTATDMALEHHRKRWPLAYKAPGFHERLVHATLPTDVLFFSCLEFRGAQIAWQMSFVDGRVLRHYMPAYDHAWRAYGVSHILRYLDIEHVIHGGFLGFDFLRGVEPYKQTWSSTVVPLYQITVQSRRAASKTRNWIVNDLRPKLRI